MSLQRPWASLDTFFVTNGPLIVSEPSVHDVSILIVSTLGARHHVEASSVAETPASLAQNEGRSWQTDT